MKGRRPRPLDDGDSGGVRVSGHSSWAKPIENKRVFCLIQSATITFMSIISNCTAADLNAAATALINGNLVAFPTETVYGLGADANNKDAVARIYEVKGRPSDHPLIVHISSIELLDKWARDIPEYALKLARAFWPGPMTLILPRTELAKDFITGGQNSIGIRVPEHAVALALLKAFEAQGGLGIAAPSANRFGKVSPTTSEAVIDELGNYLSFNDQILDGGASKIGIESTIIDCTSSYPNILRPGSINSDMIEALLQSMVNNEPSMSYPIKAPGLLDSHYSPNSQIILNGEALPGDGYIALSIMKTPSGVVRLASPLDSNEFANVLYESLRQADKLGLNRVIIIQPSNNGIGVAINDRLTKAARKKH